MRVSADKTDDGYRYFAMLKANGKDVFVFLDGVEVKNCVTADDERGFVIRYVPDEHGDVQIDPVDNNRIWEERLTGVVEIKIRESKHENGPQATQQRKA